MCIKLCIEINKTFTKTYSKNKNCFGYDLLSRSNVHRLLNGLNVLLVITVSSKLKMIARLKETRQVRSNFKAMLIVFLILKVLLIMNVYFMDQQSIRYSIKKYKYVCERKFVKKLPKSGKQSPGFFHHDNALSIYKLSADKKLFVVSV